jgi:hypothetical protein
VEDFVNIFKDISSWGETSSEKQDEGE